MNCDECRFQAKGVCIDCQSVLCVHHCWIHHYEGHETEETK